MAVTDDDGGTSADPSPAPTVVDTSTSVWSLEFGYDEERPRDEGVNGFRWDPSFVLADGVGLLLTAEEPYEGPVQTLLAVDLADGTQRWTRDAPGAVCSVVPGSVLDGARVACATDGPDGTRLALIDVGTGETAADWEVPAPVAGVVATPSGIVTVDAIDPQDGSGALRWYHPTGVLAWSEELLTLDEGTGALVEPADEDDEDQGWESGYDLVLRPSGSEVILGSYPPFRLDASGVSPLDCSGITPALDGYLCRDYPVSHFFRDGERVMSTGAELARTSLSEDLPALIGTVPSADDGPTDYVWVDPDTGVAGSLLLSTTDRVRVGGTAERPLLVAEEERSNYSDPTVTTLLALDPGDGSERWRQVLTTQQRPEVRVVGERVLVQVDYEWWEVLDAADGSRTGGLETRPYVTWGAHDGDLVQLDLRTFERRQLP